MICLPIVAGYGRSGGGLEGEGVVRCTFSVVRWGWGGSDGILWRFFPGLRGETWGTRVFSFLLALFFFLGLEVLEGVVDGFEQEFGGAVVEIACGEALGDEGDGGLEVFAAVEGGQVEGSGGNDGEAAVDVVVVLAAEELVVLGEGAAAAVGFLVGPEALVGVEWGLHVVASAHKKSPESGEDWLMLLGLGVVWGEGVDWRVNSCS